MVGGLVLVVIAFVMFTLLLYKPKEKAPTQEYLRIRAICEDKATRELPPEYAVGGNHWVDAVNRCMLDLATD